MVVVLKKCKLRYRAKTNAKSLPLICPPNITHLEIMWILGAWTYYNSLIVFWSIFSCCHLRFRKSETTSFQHPHMKRLCNYEHFCLNSLDFSLDLCYLIQSNSHDLEQACFLSLAQTTTRLLYFSIPVLSSMLLLSLSTKGQFTLKANPLFLLHFIQLSIQGTLNL